MVKSLSSKRVLGPHATSDGRGYAYGEASWATSYESDLGLEPKDEGEDSSPMGSYPGFSQKVSKRRAKNKQAKLSRKRNRAR